MSNLPPHMNPMSAAEVQKLLSAPQHGQISHDTTMRAFVMLAVWAPLVDDGVNPGFTPNQQVALGSFDELLDTEAAADYGVALGVAQALADSLRPLHAAKLHTKVCERKGWEPS